MPQLLTYQNTRFPADLNWQAVSFMRVVWPWIEGGFLRQPYEDYLRPIHFALVEQRLLISYAAVIRLEVEHAGEVCTMHGLGNVFTYPSFRGQGYGRAVVDFATRYIETSDADVGALFCDPSLESFYARSGWAASRGVTLLGPQKAPGGDESVRMMLYVSKKGRALRQAFESEPLHLKHGW